MWEVVEAEWWVDGGSLYYSLFLCVYLNIFYNNFNLKRKYFQLNDNENTLYQDCELHLKP